MNRPELEERLRAAYQVRAAQVSEADLSPAADLDAAAVDPVADAGDHRVPGRRHRVRLGRRWTMPLFAAAAVVAVVAGGVTASTLASGSHHAPAGTHPGTHPDPRPTPSGTTPAPTSSPTTPPRPSSSHHSTSHHAAPTMLAAGRQGTRSQIPWSVVGSGWTMALWTAHAPVNGEPPSNPTLFLVDPVGGRYEITTVPATGYLGIADWSGDLTRVLLREGSDTSNVFWQVDTRSGTIAKVAITSQFGSATYTSPEGLAILIDDTSGSRMIGSDGRPEVSFGVHVDGSPGNPYPARSLDAPDGRAVLFGGTNSLAYVSNTDRPIRALTAPAGPDECIPVRWWAAGTALVTCTPTSGSNTSQPDLWLLPVDGSAPTRLTDSAAGQTDLGFVDAFEVGGTTYAVQETGCGGGGILNRLTAGGATTAVTTPFGPSSTTPVDVAGATSQAFIVLPVGGCQGESRPLVAFDPATGQAQTLLGGSLNGGYVVDAKSAAS